jgi:RHS repeat-associated protein
MDEITQIQAGTAGAILNRTYTYNHDGNISSILQDDSLPDEEIESGSDAYTYVTGKDWIDNIDDGTNVYYYVYDNNGNITSDGRHTYVYNEQNQLYRVMDGQTVLGEYTYNAKGQRVKKVASSTTIYHYDLMGNLIQETDGSGNVIASYVYAGTQRIAKIEPSGTIYYYHNDHLGTPLAMTDTSGDIVWKAAYNPFGKAEVDPSSTITNNFRFPGQYYDAESGLHYNWHRYYDPGTGRYMTADPIGIKGDINLYSYVINNPIKFIDPYGLKCNMTNYAACVGMLTVGGLSYFCSKCLLWGELSPVVCGICAGAVLGGTIAICYPFACPPDDSCVLGKIGPPPPGFYQGTKYPPHPKPPILPPGYWPRYGPI